MEKVSRRDFLGKVSIWTAITAGILVAVSLLRQFVPRITMHPKRFKIARGNQYQVNTFTYLAERKLFIYRDHEGIRALSAVCTHLGCIVEKTDEGFECPCHGSRYSDSGVLLSGAAKEDLSWFGLDQDVDGRIIVDQSRLVGPDDKLYL